MSDTSVEDMRQLYNKSPMTSVRRCSFRQSVRKTLLHKGRDMQHIMQRIEEAVLSITPRMLSNVWKDLEYRLNISRSTTGAHIELH